MNIIEREDAGDDSELVSKAQKGSLIAQETLIKRYSWIARSKARNYFLEGGTFEDLEQEGLVGIWQAIKNFDVSQNVPFKAFVGKCVEWQIFDTLRSYNRNKNKTLNESVSLTDFDDNLRPELIIEVDPVTASIRREGREAFYEKLSSICAKQQIDVLKLYFYGYTYGEIAKISDLPVKKVDNILLAVKNKIKRNKELFIDEQRGD